jgi:hypothetical protein
LLGISEIKNKAHPCDVNKLESEVDTNETEIDDYGSSSGSNDWR